MVLAAAREVVADAVKSRDTLSHGLENCCHSLASKLNCARDAMCTVFTIIIVGLYIDTVNTVK